MTPDPPSTLARSAALQPAVAQILRELRAGLQAIYGERLRGIYLFGSYARGEAGPESDMDVLITLETMESHATEIDRMSGLVSDLSLLHGVSLSPVAVITSDWTERRTPFLRRMRREAIAA